MKTPAQLDREIVAIAEYINSFDTYDPANREQAIGFIVRDALMWARGRMHVKKPSDRLRDLAKERA